MLCGIGVSLSRVLKILMVLSFLIAERDRLGDGQDDTNRNSVHIVDQATLHSNLYHSVR